VRTRLGIKDQELRYIRRGSLLREVDGERIQDGTVGEACTTCGADPFSNRAVHHRSGVRFRGAKDKAAGVGGRSLLQPVGGGNFNASSFYDWDIGMAVPTGRPEVEGHPAAAPGVWVYFKRSDLDRVVVTFAGAPAGQRSAEVPIRD